VGSLYALGESAAAQQVVPPGTRLPVGAAARKGSIEGSDPGAGATGVIRVTGVAPHEVVRTGSAVTAGALVIGSRCPSRRHRAGTAADGRPVQQRVCPVPAPRQTVRRMSRAYDQECFRSVFEP